MPEAEKPKPTASRDLTIYDLCALEERGEHLTDHERARLDAWRRNQGDAPQGGDDNSGGAPC